ncbi:MAG: universal stress protein [Nitrososphaerota archaeon]|jgi:nucleotide-binding universal stress UspA family protein|nr:universal stress protein [Nitrososphaerota archaeon]MDG6922637.1 universal stress protein [Nitrososphaerota archaeon]
MFKKILVPIDGSPNSYRGFEQAVDLAKKYGAAVKLLHVIEQPMYLYAGGQIGGSGRVRSLLLGSVSNKVVNYAKGPVLIVRSE